MTDGIRPNNPDDTCYRHPSVRSFVLCQRCTRTVCGDCQIPAAVGVICPECLQNQRRAEPPSVRRARRFGGQRDRLVSQAIIAVTVVVFVAQYLWPAVTNQLFFYGATLDITGGFEPWRALTYALVHSTSLFVLHVGLNMYTLWVFGQLLEPHLGRARFLTLYVGSAVAGAVGVTVMAPNTAVIGASGATFGLMGAILVLWRRDAQALRPLLIVAGINLAIGFIPQAGIAWQAHIGGLVGGAALAFVCEWTARQRIWVGVLAGSGVGVALLGIGCLWATVTGG